MMAAMMTTTTYFDLRSLTAPSGIQLRAGRSAIGDGAYPPSGRENLCPPRADQFKEVVS